MTKEEQQAYDRLVGENRVLKAIVDHIELRETSGMSQEQLRENFRASLPAALQDLSSSAAYSAALELAKTYRKLSAVLGLPSLEGL